MTRQVEGNTTSLLVLILSELCIIIDDDGDEKHCIRTRRQRRSWSAVRRPRPGWITSLLISFLSSGATLSLRHWPSLITRSPTLTTTQWARDVSASSREGCCPGQCGRSGPWTQPSQFWAAIIPVYYVRYLLFCGSFKLFSCSRYTEFKLFLSRDATLKKEVERHSLIIELP